MEALENQRLEAGVEVGIVPNLADERVKFLPQRVAGLFGQFPPLGPGEREDGGH